MKRIDVTKKGNEWVAKSGGETVARASNKVDAVKATAEVAKADPSVVSVRIHKQDGQLQEERTYPRRSDPSRSKG